MGFDRDGHAADSLARRLTPAAAAGEPRHLGDPRREPRRVPVHLHGQPVMAEEPTPEWRRDVRGGPQPQLPRLLGGRQRRLEPPAGYRDLPRPGTGLEPALSTPPKAGRSE